MRGEIFHDDQRLRFVEVIDLGHRARITLGLADERVILEKGALQRQRPGIAHEAHIGKRLLHDHRAPGAFHDEDEVEVAVPHLADIPLAGVGPEPFGHGAHMAQPLGQCFACQRFIGCIVHAALPIAVRLQGQHCDPRIICQYILT